MKKQTMKLASVLAIFCICLLGSGCDNANTRVELSKATSDLREGVKVYAGYSFSIYRINIDGVNYLANSQGGIVRGAE